MTSLSDATLHNDTVNDMIEAQLAVWPEAKRNFDALAGCRRKSFMIGDLPVTVQLNPARIRSTGADISKESITSRPCFLCKDNRPEEQFAIPIMEGMEMLVNPYPIFPVHFTIAATAHRPQGAPPLAMGLLAVKTPGLCIFFNGAKAGASAPDHLHMQAVLSSELPLLRLVESVHPTGGREMLDSRETGLDLPFRFVSAIIHPDDKEMRTLLEILTTFGRDKEGNPDPGLVNTYFWTDSSDGMLRALAIPRKAHRPSCYAAPEPERLLVSPGAIDMAGVVITPRPEDFEKITAEHIRRIYSETGAT